MAFSVVNSACNGWTHGIRRILVWISKSVYFHVAVVSIQRLVSLALVITPSEDGLLCMHPHQVAIDTACCETTPAFAVAGKVDQVAAAIILNLFDIPHFAFAKHFCTPIPGIGDICYQCRSFRAVVGTGRFLSSECCRRHVDAATVGAVSEAGCQGNSAEFVLQSESLCLFVEYLHLFGTWPAFGI